MKKRNLQTYKYLKFLKINNITIKSLLDSVGFCWISAVFCWMLLVCRFVGFTFLLQTFKN